MVYEFFDILVPRNRNQLRCTATKTDKTFKLAFDFAGAKKSACGDLDAKHYQGSAKKGKGPDRILKVDTDCGGKEIDA
ncbi:hypothetical protein C8C94_2059 [Acidovorax sp. 94]|nr:hypothetical protein C8C94_2059 [Acidovorax sp. 94]